MPELPEVETVRRGLADLLPGQAVVRATVFDSPKSFPNSPTDVQQFLYGAHVTAVRRRAKVLMIDLDTHLFFNDQRKFGWMKLMPTDEIENLPFMQKVGPEPLDKKTEAGDFIKRIRRRQNSMIKPAFLDQSVIAGVGNIYADEALWAAKIHPQTRVRNVSDDQLEDLFDELRQILQLSIDQGGSTDKNYVDAEGRKGNYLSFAHVFRREGQPCHRHPDQEIVKMKVSGRGTHICPVCQVEVK